MDVAKNLIADSFDELANFGQWTRYENDGRGVTYTMVFHLHGNSTTPSEETIRQALQPLVSHTSLAEIEEGAKGRAEMDEIRKFTGKRRLDHLELTPLVEQQRQATPPILPVVHIWHDKKGAHVTLTVTENEYNHVIAPKLKKPSHRQNYGRYSEREIKGGNGNGKSGPHISR